MHTAFPQLREKAAKYLQGFKADPFFAYHWDSLVQCIEADIRFWTNKRKHYGEDPDGPDGVEKRAEWFRKTTGQGHPKAQSTLDADRREPEAAKKIISATRS